MKRIWSIEEQVYIEPSTKFRFEFTSTHTRALAAGEPPPKHDELIEMNLFNESGSRVMRMTFLRNGLCQGAAVENVGEDEPLPQPAPVQELPMLGGAGGETAARFDPNAEAQQQAQFTNINYASQFSGDIK